MTSSPTWTGPCGRRSGCERDHRPQVRRDVAGHTGSGAAGGSPGADPRPRGPAGGGGGQRRRPRNRQPDVPGTDTERARELDRALATGEDRSTALLAATLWGLGVAARSLRGGEAGVRAEGGFGTGRIVMVDPRPIHHLLDQGVVPVVSGFQGRRSDGETVTLGRGGSDTTAVAIAAALGAICHLVSDVPAVYDRDPNRDPSAHPFASLGHGELVALIDGGERVIHPSAAELARDASVPLRLYHFRAPLAGSGTRIEAAPAGVAADNGRRA
jgi:aspartate kinase